MEEPKQCGPKGVGGLVERALKATGVGSEAVYGVNNCKAATRG